MAEKAAKKNEVSKWVIGSCNTNGDGVEVYIAIGTENDVKKMLAQEVRNARDENPDEFEYGTTAAKDVTGDQWAIGELYASATFDDFHIDWSASRIENIETCDLTKKACS